MIRLHTSHTLKPVLCRSWIVGVSPLYIAVGTNPGFGRIHSFLVFLWFFVLCFPLFEGCFLSFFLTLSSLPSRFDSLFFALFASLSLFLVYLTAFCCLTNFSYDLLDIFFLQDLFHRTGSYDLFCLTFRFDSFSHGNGIGEMSITDTLRSPCLFCFASGLTPD